MARLVSSEPGLIRGSLDEALDIIERLRGGAAYRYTQDEVARAIETLLEGGGSPLVGYDLSDSSGVARGRVMTGTRFRFASEVSYCPVKFSNAFGRCHRPGTTVFYGAFERDTILPELLPEIGARVVIGVARMLDEHSVKLTAVGELDHFRRYKRPLFGGVREAGLFGAYLHRLGSEAGRALLVDAFFADLFATPAAKPRDYKLTSALAEKVLNSRDERDNAVFDGFVYPSVAHRGGLNIVIKPEVFDANFYWTEFTEIEIVNYLGYGLYLSDVIARSSGVDPSSGEIAWTDA